MFKVLWLRCALPDRQLRGQLQGRGGHGRRAHCWARTDRMGRKPKRVRDPNRSHANGKRVASTPRVAFTSHSLRRATVAADAGWMQGKLTDALGSTLLRALAATSLSGPQWKPHSNAGEQGNDLPMLQLDLSGIREQRANWWLLLQEVVAQSGMACPCCGAAVASHDMVTADLNQVRPQAAIWPHRDVVLGGGGPVLLVLLQPAQQGGNFMIAKKPDVSWRVAGAGGMTLARRARDTVYVPLQECGEVCCFDGCTYAHEVSRVYGSEPRLTVSITLACGP